MGRSGRLRDVADGAWLWAIGRGADLVVARVLLWVGALLAGLIPALGGGCAARGGGAGLAGAAPATTIDGASFFVDEDQYRAAFDASRETLLAWRWPLERVDFEQGIVSTGEKRTSGLLSPWDREQSGFTLIDDFANHQVRRARVRFTRSATGATDAASGTGPGTAPDIGPGAVRCDVEVFVYRLQTPNLRVPERAVGLATQAFDPLAARRGVAGRYEAPLSRDDAAAMKIATQVRARLGV